MGLLAKGWSFIKFVPFFISLFILAILKACSLDPVGVGAQAKEKTRLILGVPIGERTFSAYLVERVLKGKTVDATPIASAGPRAKSAPRRGKEPIVELSTEDEAEENLFEASPTMSSETTRSVRVPFVPAADALLEMELKRRKASAPSVAESTKRPIPTRGGDSGRKAVNLPKPSTPTSRKRHAVEFPEGYGDVLAKPHDLWPEIERLWMPVSQERHKRLRPQQLSAEAVSQAFQTLQSAIASHHSLVSLGLKVDMKDKAANDARLDAAKANNRALQLDAEKAVLQVDLDKVQADLRAAREELETCRADLEASRVEAEARRAEVLQAAGYYVWKTRAELMEEYKEGKHVQWSPSDVIDKFNTVYGPDYVPPSALIREEAVATSPDVALVDDVAVERKDGADDVVEPGPDAKVDEVAAVGNEGTAPGVV